MSRFWRKLIFAFPLGVATAERLLSYSLLSLITGKPLASAPTTGGSGSENEDEDEDERTFKLKRVLNEEGAWCWKEGCEGLLPRS